VTTTKTQISAKPAAAMATNTPVFMVKGYAGFARSI
jgi:hypothetical protein